MMKETGREINRGKGNDEVGHVDDIDFPGGRGVGREEATLNPKICNMFFLVT